jgi:hypothetical protein
MGGNSLSAGVGWPQLLWGSNQGGLIDNNAGPPMMNFAGNTPYTNIGQQWQQFGYEKNDRWQFSNDLTWVKGRHTAKFGIEYRRHIFPSRGWATNTGGAFNFDRLGTGGYDSAGNNLSQTGDRSCWARCSRPARPSRSIRHSTKPTRRRGSTTNSR